MYVCMYYVCAYVRMYVCTYVRMYVCTYVRMYVHAYCVYGIVEWTPTYGYLSKVSQILNPTRTGRKTFVKNTW